MGRRCIGFPGGISGKESAYNTRATGDMGSVSESGKSLEGGNSNTLQYSCLDNPMDREAWRATVHRDAKSPTQLKHPGMQEEDVYTFCVCVCVCVCMCVCVCVCVLQYMAKIHFSFCHLFRIKPISSNLKSHRLYCFSIL